VLYERLQADGTLHVTSDGVELTPAGARRLQSFGIDTETLRAGRRPLARTCLDWTERRHHLAGASHFDVDVSVLTEGEL
jgi:hypothetical protein